MIQGASGTLMICATDSIRVRLAGVFPDHCYSIEGIEIAESFPPSLNVVVALECSTRCIQSLKPWAAEVVLPPMPVGDYMLRVAVRQNVCPSGPDTTLGSGRFAFSVEHCPGTGDCFLEGWAPGPDSTYCHARIGPGGTASVVFTVASEVDLAGLQGSFQVSSPALRITKIEPTTVTEGMHVTWTPTPEGARFVMFGGRGIAACVLDSIPPNVRIMCPIPTLKLTLAPTGKRLPLVTSVTAYDLLGSDAHGTGIPRCPIMTLVPIEARICSEGECDINADGWLDIRDIVIQAQCLGDRDTTALDLRVGCPTDCNLDGNRNLEDVLCCARQILLGPPCVDCPPDTSTPLPAPNVQVGMGDVEADGDVLTVPFWVEGLADVGGALLSFDYPEDRYDAVVRFEGSASEWLRLHETAGGEARVGLLRLNQISIGPITPVRTLIELTLKSGRSHGGRIAVNRAEFSSPSGRRLDASHVLPSASLSLKPAVALSEPRPNPTSLGATLTLSLSLAADALVQVYDLGGRAVATVHRGPLAAGVHELTWNGRRDGGASLNAGIYFMRAAAGGADATRKIVVLGH